MLRCISFRLARTSRRGGGSWSHPAVRDSGVASMFAASHSQASATASRNASGRSPSVEEVSHDNTIHAADNPTAYGLRDNPYRNNWKAAEPMAGHFSYADFRHHMEAVRRERGAERGSTTSTETPRSDDFQSHHGTASSSRGAWRGETEIGGSGEGPAAGGAASSLFKRGRPRTITELCRNLVDAAFEPRESDSKAFGGDGATERAQRKEELKHLDPRITPIFHEELMRDTLRSVQALRTPSGAIVPNGRDSLLKGRLVGLLFFSESDRSMAFMRRLRTFHAAHHPDFITVAISLAGKEMLDVTRGFGFYHLTHREGGATWVTRDVGLEMKLLVPLPRLVVVDGSTGKEISRRGVTEVVAHPESCFEWWRRGDSDCTLWDYCKTWYLSDGYQQC